MIKKCSILRCGCILLFCLILGVGILLRVTGKSEQIFSGQHLFEENVAVREPIYEGIALKPGIYEISLQYETDRDYSAHFNIEGNVVHQRLLRTNGEHAYAGLQHTGFTLWLLEPVSNLKVIADYSGEGQLTTYGLTVQNTGKLWTLLAVVFMLLWGACLIVFWLFQELRGAGFPGFCKNRTIRVGFFLLLITLLASVSQLNEYLLGGADLTYHLQRIEGVKDSLLAGQFPIRIEPNWLYGHGYANGVFYCDALLYFPALLRLAGFPINIAYNLYCIALNLATAWIAWYCFGKIFRDDTIGLMCSALYTLSIIRLYKLAIVGAVGEGSAITFLPLIFYGMYQVFMEESERTRAWLPLALGYAGLIQTHVLTCEITAFLTILVCIIGIGKIRKMPVFCQLAKGALGALGLSMWYLVPFLDYFLTQDMHIRHVAGRTIQYRGLYFLQLFVNHWSDKTIQKLEEAGLSEVEPVGVGLLLMGALLVFFVLWISGILDQEKEREDLRRFAKISTGFGCLLLWMTLKIFPWNRIWALGGAFASLVSSLQFPNRFLGWAMVFLIFIFGTCIWRFRNRRLTYWVGILLTGLSIVTGSLYMMKDATKEESRLYLYNEAGMGFGYISGAEYLVQGTEEGQLSFNAPVLGEHIILTDYEKGSLQAELTCENPGDKESYIDLPLLRYKGYQAKTKTGEKLVVTDGQNHLVRVIIPGGFDGNIWVGFVSPLYWRISEMITLLSIGLLGWYLYRDSKNKKKALTLDK